MISTACPSCDRLTDFIDCDLEDFGKWCPVRCDGCDRIMWVYLTNLLGETLSSEDFFARIVAPEDVERVRQLEADFLAEAEAGAES